MSTVDFDTRHNSRQLVDGPSRAAARAQLKGIGFDDEALAKPIIGVASTWTAVSYTHLTLPTILLV